MAADWVDFKTVKATVSMQMVLERYGIAVTLKKKGNELRGKCPLQARKRGPVVSSAF